VFASTIVKAQFSWPFVQAAFTATEHRQETNAGILVGRRGTSA
jgi:hypothetical protein